MLFKKSEISTNLSPGKLTWRRFRRIPTAMAGLGWIVFTAMLAATGYLFIPDNSPHANHQQLELAAHKPGTRQKILHVAVNKAYSSPSLAEQLLRGKPSPYNTIPIQSYRFAADTLHYETYPGQPGYPGLEGYYLLPDVLYHLDGGIPVQQVADDTLSFVDAWGNTHRKCIGQMQEEVQDKRIHEQWFPLGTDRFGRDLLSQLVIGTRVSLSVGFIAVFISLVIGISLGSLAGYFRGRTDQMIVWLINVVWSVPTLLLAIAITFALGKGFWQVFVAVGLTMWVEVARVVRGQVISIREKEFVESARALGLGSLRIIRRHILPVIMGPVIVISAANFASAILIEAGLSFLGIGVQPPVPSWGTMIREHYGYIILDKGYLAFLPGLAIMLMVLSFMLLGNGLREALDRGAKD